MNRLTLDPLPFADRQGLIRYPVPLHGARFAHLHLPGDLRGGDVARIVAFLQALAIDDEPPAPAVPARV